MKFAIIIRGPAGVGKSEISNKLKQEIPNLIHLDIDKFKHIISEESSEIRTNIAHNTGMFFLKQLINNNFNIVVEEIFREKYYKEITNFLEDNNYKTTRVFLMATEQALIERDKNRQKNKGEKIIRKINQEIKPLDEDLIIDTTKKDVEEIKQIILKELKKIRC